MPKNLVTPVHIQPCAEPDFLLGQHYCKPNHMLLCQAEARGSLLVVLQTLLRIVVALEVVEWKLRLPSFESNVIQAASSPCLQEFCWHPVVALDVCSASTFAGCLAAGQAAEDRESCADKSV